ncbi:MAG: hypothetical protein V1789_04030 [PVC group bacterium]
MNRYAFLMVFGAVLMVPVPGSTTGIEAEKTGKQPSPGAIKQAAEEQILRYPFSISPPLIRVLKGPDGEEYSLIEAAGCTPSGEPGEPALPGCSKFLVLPPGVKVIGVELKVIEKQTVPLPHPPYPVQPEVNMDEEPPPFVSPKRGVYREGACFPEGNFQFAGTNYWQGCRVAVCGFYPCRAMG